MTFDDYCTQVLEDAKEAIADTIAEDITEFLDECFVDDAVTGNGSGSYTFNAAQAAENVSPAMFDERFHQWVDEIRGIDVHTILECPEALDVTIRLAALDYVSNDIEEAWNEAKGMAS